MAKPRAIVSRGSDLKFLPASHENNVDPGALKKILFEQGALPSGQVQMVNWALIPAGKSFQNHYHEDMYEVFIITSGYAQMRVNEETFLLESGDAVLVPPLAVHSMSSMKGVDVGYIVFGVSSGEGGRTIVTQTS